MLLVVLSVGAPDVAQPGEEGEQSKSGRRRGLVTRGGSRGGAARSALRTAFEVPIGFPRGTLLCMSKRTGLTVLVVALAAVIAWLVVWRPDAPGAASEPQAGTGITRPAATDVQLVDARSAPVRTVETTAEEEFAQRAQAEQATATDPVATAATEREKPDMHAKIPFALLVVDELREPVFDAEVLITGMRSENGRGAWYPYRGEHERAQTDPKGRAEFKIWKWVDIDGKTKGLDLQVTHPDFTPFRDGSFKIAGDEHTIVLQRGSIVSVRAWHGMRAATIDDIVIDLDRGTRLARDAWTRESDGRYVTTQVAPGKHFLRVASATAEAGAPALVSRIESFEVLPNERLDLTIELHGLTDFVGELDASVPRPVVDGHAMLTITNQEYAEGTASLWYVSEAEVREDGTFTLHDLQPGRGYLLALTRGHVSTLAASETEFDSGIRYVNRNESAAEKELMQQRITNTWVLQRTTIPASTVPFVVSMEATGRIEITVRDPDNEPVAGARVTASPNYQVPGVGSSILPWRDWSAITDDRGIAAIADLPPQDELWFGVTADGFQLNAKDRRRPPSIQVKGAGTTSRSIVLERVEAPTPK